MAMPRYLLDTNIMSDLVRHPQGRIAERIAQIGEGAVCTSIIVACELRFAAVRKGSVKLTTQVESILAAMEILPFEVPADHVYAQLRQTLEQAGTPIGPNDMLIAAQALTAECVLVTANVSEFSRVAGLSVVNWLEPLP